MSFPDKAALVFCAVVLLIAALHPTWRALVREMPSFYTDRIDRWLLRQHGPFDTAGDGTGPATCRLCKTGWPCDEFITVDRRIDRRINEQGKTT